MYNGTVPDVSVRSDNEVKAWQAVQNTIVLHIGAAFKDNSTEVSSQRCARSYVAICANNHVTDNDCIRVHKGA